MDNFDGQIMFALIVALLLAWGASQLIARLYSKKVLQFMQAKSATMAASTVIDAHHRQRPIVTDLSLQNRYAVWRLRAALILITVIMGAMMAYVAQAAYVVDGFSWRRLMVLTVVYAWSSVPAIGLLERWSRLKILLASVSYVALSGMLVILNSKETPDFGSVFTWLFFEQLPLLIFVFVMTGRTLRSVGPYLLLVFFPLTTSSLVGLSVLDTAINKGPDTWVIDLVMMTNSYVVFALFGIFPWLIAFYPIRFFANRIALAYRHKVFSEPLYLLAGLW